MAKVFTCVGKIVRAHSLSDLLTPGSGRAVPADEVSHHVSWCPLGQPSEKDANRKRANTGGACFKGALEGLENPLARHDHSSSIPRRMMCRFGCAVKLGKNSPE